MNFAFSGCSLTFGEGFPKDLRDRYIYDRLVSNHFGATNTNFGIPGGSNHKIFISAASAIQSKKFDVVFVQWSGVNRLWLSPGPDVHLFLQDEKFPDFRYRNLYLSPKELTNFKNLIRLLNHDYQNILDLIDYCSFLELMSDNTSTKIIFINGLLHWKEDICNPLSSNLSECLSDYSKNLLDFDNRDDEEIINLFTKLQTKFKSIDQDKWVNIFDSLKSNTIDVGPEGHHPGINSHAWLANKIIDFINIKKIL
jgi:hypothetical protein